MADLLAAGGGRMVYQPILDMPRRRVFGFKALSRFPMDSGSPPREWYRKSAEVGTVTSLAA